MRQSKKTTVGAVDAEVLAFTAGEDLKHDMELLEADLLGTAAHVTMLSHLPLQPPLITPAERRNIIRALHQIARGVPAGRLQLDLADQDVHLAVERLLTEMLGDLGRKVHTARSRNDQVATDLRLYSRERLLEVLAELSDLALTLTELGYRHRGVPMVGRTHMQPAMPSSVGLWATAHAESLLDNAAWLLAVYALNNQCPLGSAASYGVPLPIDRQETSDLLGFSRPVHNVLYANNARGELEYKILSALSSVVIALSRLSQDLMLWTLPEFGYFTLPAEFCTGSSIMPQKRNPDVLELIRGRAAILVSLTAGVGEVVRAAPSGYNRDVQETKGPLIRGFAWTRDALRILNRLVAGLEAHPDRMRAAFSPEVFATDRALQLVAEGMPFRKAYETVKEQLSELEAMDPDRALARKKHLGAPAGLDFGAYRARTREIRRFVESERKRLTKVYQRLMGASWKPVGEEVGNAAGRES